MLQKQMLIKKIAGLLLLSLFVISRQGAFAKEDPSPSRFEIETPSITVKGAFVKVVVKAVDGEGKTVTSYRGSPRVEGLSVQEEGKKTPLQSIGPFEDGTLTLSKTIPENGRILIKDQKIEGLFTITLLPGFLSLLPPLIAILLLPLFSDRYSSLFLPVSGLGLSSFWASIRQEAFFAYWILI